MHDLDCGCTSQIAIALTTAKVRGGGSAWRSSMHGTSGVLLSTVAIEVRARAANPCDLRDIGRGYSAEGHSNCMPMQRRRSRARSIAYGKINGGFTSATRPPPLSDVSGPAPPSISGTACVHARSQGHQHLHRIRVLCLRALDQLQLLTRRPRSFSSAVDYTIASSSASIHDGNIYLLYPLPQVTQQSHFNATVGQPYGRRIAIHPDQTPRRPLRSARMVVHRTPSPPRMSLLIPCLLLICICLPTAQAINWMSAPELVKDLTVYQSFVAATVGLQLW